jgi:hypothetical protein
MATVSSAQRGRERVIIEQPGVPLESRLLPDDEVVVLERAGYWDGIVFLDPVSKANMIEDRLAGSDIAVVLDIDGVQGMLTDDRSWIRTRVTGV